MSNEMARRPRTPWLAFALAAFFICEAAGAATYALSDIPLAGYGLIVLGVVAPVVLLVLRWQDLSREWRKRFNHFRIREDLCAREISESTRRELDRMEADGLWAASVQPAHSPAGRQAAGAALARKSDRSVLPPLYVPGFVGTAHAGRIVHHSFGLRYRVANILRWISLASFVSATIVLIIYVIVDEVDTEKFLDNAFTVLFVTGVVSFMIRRLLMVFRHNPARVLFLRKFNDKKLARGFRNFSKIQVRPFGHLILLSDRNLKIGWVWWFVQRFPVLAEDPTELLVDFAFDALFIPYVLICRNFNSIFFGPPKASRARDFRTLPKALRRKRWMNLQAQRFAMGFYLRCSDDWWRPIAEVFMLSSDVILLDVTTIAGGTEWEIDNISRLGLWSRVVVVREAVDGLPAGVGNPAVDKAISEYSCGPHVYRQNGKLADVSAFRSDVQSAIVRAVAQNRERWPDLIP
jgi:hypothetical protein